MSDSIKVQGNVIKTLRLVLFLEYILGIFRFRIKNETLQPVDGKLKSAGIFIVATFSCSFLYIILSASPAVSEDDFATVVYNHSSLYFIVINYIFTFIINSCTQSGSTVKIFSNFGDLDSMLYLATKYGFYENSMMYVNIMFMLICLINILIIAFFYTTNTIDIIGTAITLLVYHFQDNGTLFLCVMIFMLRYRLTTINYHIKDIIVQGQTMSNVNTIARFNTERFLQRNRVLKLHDLSLAYQMVGETCDIINKLFNFHILILLASAFMNIIYSLWFFLWYSFCNKVIELDILITIGWACMKVVHVTVLTIICESLLRTRISTLELVNELVMDYGRAAGARAQAKAFLRLVNAWPLRVAVYDLINVDLSLLFKFVNAATTYFIVLIQATGSLRLCD